MPRWLIWTLEAFAFAMCMAAMGAWFIVLAA